MRILVVEDDQDIREFLKSSLEAESFSVDAAADGQQGSILARTNNYDVIVLDNVLPHKSGGEICKEIRDKGGDTPIIMLSVESDPLQKIDLLNVGADDFLAKPFTFGELLARIRAVLRRARTSEAQAERFSQLYRFAEFGRLASGLFHDMMNPLTTVSLYLEKANETGDTGSAVSTQVYLEKAFDATKRIEQMTKAMRKQLQHRETEELFSLIDATRQVIQLLAHKAWEAKVHISFHAPDASQMYGDSLKFHQVIMNLVSNAIDSYMGLPLTEDRKREVAITIHECEGNISIKVQDWGQGIPQNLIEKVYQPFFTTKQQWHGLGIGLSTTRDIVEKTFRGTLNLSSVENRGTIFTVEFRSPGTA